MKKTKCASKNISGTSRSSVDYALPELAKIHLPAAVFAGGVGKQFFNAKENFGNSAGVEIESISQTREVISLAGNGSGGSAVETQFTLNDDFFSNDDFCRKHMLWIHGMWDHYKNLSVKFSSLHKTMPTFGKFRITINDKIAFDDYIFFWNYRRWKFWPCVTLEVSEEFFKSGKNTLRCENLTQPFLEDIPDYYRPFSSLPGGVAQNEIPTEIKNNTLFHLSDIDIVTQTFGDMAILNCPDTVNIASRFSVEIFATRKHDIEFDLPDGITAVKTTQLNLGRNILFFKAKKPDTNLSLILHSKTTGCSSAATIKRVINVPAGNFLLGHIIGGHLSAFPVNHDYKHLVELFRDTGQGNLLVWLADPRKAGDYITNEMLPLKYIKDSGMKVVLRYYGNAYSFPFPSERPYHEEVCKIATELGDAFVGLAAHEFGSHAREALDETGRRDLAIEKFAVKAGEVIAEFKALIPRCKVWITDPSLYSDVYCQVGADMPGLELFPLHCTLNIAACRGAAKAFRKDGWAAINSFECQAYGGLDMLEPKAYLDMRHAEKRLNLWRLSQFYLYLAGSRIIYSESGAFEQVVGRQLALDHPDMVQFRQVQKNLFDFSKIHPLSNQPVSEFAFIKSDKDIFGGNYAPSAMQEILPSDSTWEKLRVAIPQLRWRDKRLISQSEQKCRPDFSDTPFGEVDIIPVKTVPAVLGQYRAAVLVGQHEISAAQAKNLKKYAQDGGQLIVTLADFLNEDGKTSNPKILKELCGVTSGSQSQNGFLWEIKVCDSNFKRDLGNIHIPCLLGRGAYDGLIIGNLELSDSTEPIICDAFTNEPFLIRKQIGRGAVWLINAAQHHANSDYLNLVNRIIETVFRQARGPLRLIDGENINYFLYEEGSIDETFRQVFVLNNDWYSTQNLHRAKFSYDDLIFYLNVNREQPAQFFLWQDVVILPESHQFRINSILRKTADDIEIECEDAGETALRLYSLKRIKAAKIDDANGEFIPLRLNRNNNACVMFNAKLCGLHKLWITLC